MKVRSLVWLGIQTDGFDAMAGFMEAILGMPPSQPSPGFAFWTLPSGDLVEVFAGGTKPPFGSAPVVGFLVDDLVGARVELAAAGAEILGGYGPNEDGYESVHFRAPDGNIYELVHDPLHETRAPAAGPPSD